MPRPFQTMTSRANPAATPNRTIRNSDGNDAMRLLRMYVPRLPVVQAST